LLCTGFSWLLSWLRRGERYAPNEKSRLPAVDGVGRIELGRRGYGPRPVFPGVNFAHHRPHWQAAKKVRAKTGGRGMAVLRMIGCAAALMALACASSSAVRAQDWPSKPVKVIVPFTAGGSTDRMGRVVADELSRVFKQQFVVENRVGAGGTVGSNAVAKAAPDGYTLLVHSSSFTAAAAVYSSLPYDTLKDFAPVARLGLQPTILVTAPTKEFKTAADLIKAAKERPGQLNYASAGVGSASHFAVERFRLAAGFQGQHVPFRGPNEAMSDVMAGRVDFYFLPLAPAMPLLQDKRLVGLAVSTPKRLPALPEVPTMTELGLGDAAYPFWTGIFLPRQTPREIVDRLQNEALKAVADPGVQERFAKLGIDPFPLGLPEFERYFAEDFEATQKLAREAGVPKGN
jgi:tripartite-type tricarboxylate transporter receptor subunit TctC